MILWGRRGYRLKFMVESGLFGVNCWFVLLPIIQIARSSM